MSEPRAKKIKLAHKLNYRDGLFLGPMVRCGTLPTRLLSLHYGATLVWGPETVDRAIIGTERVVDEKSQTIQYQKNKKSLFECHPIEKSRLIYQIGSSDPELALKAAKIVENDVAGVDLNCGCPKDFSLKGGMGAALLKEPEKLCAILRNLVENLSVPVSAKIRMLPEQEPTLELVRKILSTGISCLTVHCRTQTMRDREPAMLHRLRDIVEIGKEFGVPVVANGDCFGTQDQKRICELTGVTSIMIARGAEDNASCFAPSLADPLTEVLPLYTKLAVLTNNAFQNTKYCIYQMDLGKTSKPPVPGIKQTRVKFRNDLSHLKTYDGLCELLGIDYEECNAIKSIEEVLPGLEGKLRAQDGEIARETREELRAVAAEGDGTSHVVSPANGADGEATNTVEEEDELKHKNDKGTTTSLANGHGPAVTAEAL